MKKLYKCLSFAIIVVVTIVSSCSKEQMQIEENEVAISRLSKSGGYNDVETSAGWDLVMDLGSTAGYKLYQNGIYSDYLQKINLTMGATLQFVFGTEYPNPLDPTSPFFKKNLISSFWENRPSKAISVTNCSFFMPDNGYNNEDSVRLSFPIKSDGVLRSTGSDNSKQGKKKIGFNFSTQEAWIADFDLSSYSFSLISSNFSSPFVICGYSPNTPEVSGGYTERLFIGIKDQDHDSWNTNEVVYILSYTGTITSAKNKLINLGCSESNIIMLDGSDSSQMIAKDPNNSSSTQFEFHKDSRTIPNGIFICKP